MNRELSSETPRPNIILINCDDLGYGDLGCYGSSVNNTAAIDRLATEGTRFSDFYMASPLCSPSRCAMLTGCYPPRIGCGEFDGLPVLFPGQAVGLNPNETTIAKLLQSAGYATALVGKWHCGDQAEFHPIQHGFDHYYGLPYSNDMGMMHARPKASIPLPLMRDKTIIQEQPDQTALTERYVEESIRFIRENQDRPFFLYFAHMHVHRPLLVSERFLRESENGPYGAAVECIDWATGALMYELKQRGLDNDTLVIFTSDNGSLGAEGGDGGSNYPLRGTKATNWEGGQRVPCIIHWPGQVPAGRVSGAIVSGIDFFPTIAALTGITYSSTLTIDGLDFSDLLLGCRETSPRETFFYYWKNSLCAVRRNKWKLWKHRRTRDEEGPVRELYDLESDIGEKHNLYEREREVVAMLEKDLQQCREEIGDTLTGTPGRRCRPIGRVNTPRPLTRYDPNHPYIIAMYDGDAG